MIYQESMKLEAVRLHDNGYSVREIAKKLVFPSRMTIWRWINGSHER